MKYIYAGGTVPTSSLRLLRAQNTINFTRKSNNKMSERMVIEFYSKRYDLICPGKVSAITRGTEVGFIMSIFGDYRFLKWDH